MSVPNWRTKPQTKITYYAPDGETYVLHSPPDKVVVGMSGWGLSPHDTFTTRGPYQQGETVIGQRLRPREITMTVHHNGCDKNDFWGNRSTLVDIFRENRTNLNYPTPGRLRFTYQQNGAPVVREVKAFYNQGFAFQPENLQYWDGFAIRETVSFVAYDPVVYDPTAITVAIPALTEDLVLPMDFPFVLGAWGGSSAITYTGTWESWPTIVITGPATGFAVYNEGIDRIIRLDTDIAGGETVTISLEYDNKYVTSDLRGDITYTVVESDLESFGLREDPTVTGGVNTLYFYVENYDPGNTTITLTYYNRYRGF